MKLFFTLLVLSFSTVVFADEVINLRADMIIIKCEDLCVAPVQEGKPIEVTLRASEGSNLIRGQYNIEKLTDGINFSGTINIFKFNENNQTKYFIQSFLSSLKGDNSTNQSLGNVIVLSTINNLNNIIWKGMIRDGDSTYLVCIIVGSDMQI